MKTTFEGEQGRGLKPISANGFPDWGGVPLAAYLILAMSFWGFHVYTGVSGVFTTMIQRPMHLLFALLLFPFIYPSGIFKKKSRLEALFNIVVCLAGAICMIYIMQNWVRFYVEDLTPLDLALAALTILVVFEFTRRVLGWVLVILASVFMVYAWIGGSLPGAIAHRGYDVADILTLIVVGTEGLFTTPLGVSATYIALFIFFAAALQATGATTKLMNLSLSIAGASTGGPAKVAVVSSALMGTLSGSVVANVTSTGSITIPMMIKSKYPRHIAGAIESCASMGGSITPPIMGATAFVIAEFTGSSYFDVVAAATIPAVLYYLSLFAMVHIRSKKLGMHGLSRENIPFLKDTFLGAANILIPIGILVALLAAHFTSMLAATWAIFSLLASAALRKDTRIGWRGLVWHAAAGSRMMMQVVAACAVAGIVIAMLNLTGFGPKLGNLVVDIASGNLLVGLILTQITALILGMGLVTVASYTLLAVLVAGALIDLGAPVMAAHMFIFYFSLVGTITPPVMLAAYAASGLAEANPFKVGFAAVRFGVIAFIIPYMFVFAPGLLLEGTSQEILLHSLKGVLAVLSLVVLIEGWPGLGIEKLLRFLAPIAVVCLVVPQTAIAVVGMTLGGVILVAIVWNSFRKKVPGEAAA